MLEPGVSLIVIGVVGFIFILIFFSFVPIPLWINALFAGVKVSLGSLVGMRLRKVPPTVIVNSLITAVKAGLNLTTDDLETHYLAGGNVVNVVQALIAADKASIEVDFQTACGIDLAGRNILDAIQTSVNPRVIDAPREGKIGAVAKDGIQVFAKARVTVRTNIKTLVGGATEETIVARVGEGIVSAIGSSASYKLVLENPDSISKTVLQKGLDTGTAFEILSIDIADVDVGQNIGANLQAEQAESDLKVARAKAETRRAMAVAQEQEMQARVSEMKSKVVEAEAEVPKAIADAFRNGNLGIMDYYKMNNIMADTEMRKNLVSEVKAEDKA
ncbi:MAG: flotillin-like protein FloA [Candidatus Delongbacteria bacterium]|nr:flotillin-like protein FloA [Candidatus Delongbacteria bacterium]MBN2835924.1 flotillin-like protein FloA [Candidatus Delongbacteria bacterium]